MEGSCGLLVFLSLSCESSWKVLCVFWPPVLYHVPILQIFSPSLLAFSVSTLLIRFFKEQAFLILRKFCVLWNPCLTQDHKDFLIFSSISFIVLCLTFRFDSFWVSFWCQNGLRFLVCACAYGYLVVSAPFGK